MTTEFLLQNYARLPITMVKGEGSFLWDSAGSKYLDLFVGFGGGGVVGHSNPEVAAAVSEQAATLCAHGNLFSNPIQEELASKLVEKTFPGKVFFCHSGAEADEAALKLVRKRSEGKRYKVISFQNSFHGRTFGGLSLTPPSFQAGLGPMLPGNILLPFNDSSALERAVDDEVGGIFVEPIQGEGGINQISDEFANTIMDLCKKKDLVLVCDEVWSGPGRTGSWFAYQDTPLKPDVLTCAKALGGGLPLACTIVSERFVDVLGPGTHGCTLGGNPVCAIAGLQVMKILERDKLHERAKTLGEKVMKRFEGQRFRVKGSGLMLGVQLSGVEAPEVSGALLDKKIIVATAKNNVLRAAPALNIEEKLLMEGVDHIISTVQELGGG